MYLMMYLDTEGKRVYTLLKKDPQGRPTQSAHPGAFTAAVAPAAANADAPMLLFLLLFLLPLLVLVWCFCRCCVVDFCRYCRVAVIAAADVACYNGP
jgi:hypothetical protein